MHILGGQAVQAERLLWAWNDDPEVQAWLVPINPVAPAWLRGASRIKYVRTLITQMTYWPLLLRELRHADVVHVFSASYFSFILAPLPAVLVARLYGKPVVMNYRSGEAPDHLRRSCGGACRAARGRPQRGTVAVPPGGLREFRHSVRDRAQHRGRRSLRVRRRSPLAPKILSTRNFEGLYNVACTLRAFQLVQREHPDATLTLVGGGSQEGALRALAVQLGLRHVTFAGRVSPSEIWRYYADADIYVQTPDIDNMPSSILEAFASGCPVVASDAGGVPAILTHDTHGLLVRCNDHHATAEAISRLLKDQTQVDRLTAAARESCEKYRWSNVRARWVALYRQLAGPDAVPEPNPA